MGNSSKLLRYLNRHSQTYFIFFILLMGFKIAHAEKVVEYDEAVSLGSMCQVAHQLQANGIRHHAYPFDWIITPAEGLSRFIAQKGEGFLERENLAFGELWANTNFIVTTDTLYDFKILHDFSVPFEESYAPVKEKYDRRKERFFKLLKSNKKVLFVRAYLTRSQAERLDHVLRKFYPKLSYTILALNETEENWGLERVKNFQLNQIPNDWRGDPARWQEILSQFRVKQAKTLPPEDRP